MGQLEHRFAFDGILRCWALFPATCPDKLMQIWRPSVTLCPRLPTEHHHRTRRAANQHHRQLQEDHPGSHPGLLQRFVFGLIRVWNCLPTMWFTARVFRHSTVPCPSWCAKGSAPKMRTGTCGCRHAAAFCNCFFTFVTCQGFIRPVAHLHFTLYMFPPCTPEE